MVCSERFLLAQLLTLGAETKVMCSLKGADERLGS